LRRVEKSDNDPDHGVKVATKRKGEGNENSVCSLSVEPKMWKRIINGMRDDIPHISLCTFYFLKESFHFYSHPLTNACIF
jgi:hypothetical protein